MRTHNTVHIPIIGGGSVGPMQLIYFAQHAKANNLNLNDVHFHGFDPNGFANGGLAYGQARANDKLNSLTNEMSPWDRDAFTNYCREKTSKASTSAEFDKNSFVNRQLYVPFIQKEVTKAIQIIKELGGSFSEHTVAAQVKPSTTTTDTQSFNITDLDGHIILEDIPAENITLCPGYGHNTLFNALENKLTTAQYTHSIYNVDPQALVHNIQLNAIKRHTQSELDNVQYSDEKQTITEEDHASPRTKILYIGSGPGLADFLNNLDIPEKQVDFYIASSSGKSIGERDPTTEDNDKHYQPEHLDALRNNFDEFENIIPKELQNADEQGIAPRRSALDIIHQLNPIIKQPQGNQDTSITKRDIYKKLMHQATPTPRESHAVIACFDPTWIEARIQSGNVSPNGDGTVTLSLNNTDYTTQPNLRGIEIKFDHVINGTGHTKLKSPLIQQMIEDKLVEVIPEGILKTKDEDGYISTGSNIAVIGPPTHLGVDGIESYAIYANKNAKRLVQQLGQTPKLATTVEYEPPQS